MKLLLINPTIYDFSAFDSWMKPLGLLYISNILKSLGHKVIFLDCMDRNLQNVKQKKSDGTGKFEYEVVYKPEILKDVPFKYKRYGIKKEKIVDFLSLNKDVDYVLITSVMTYWYLGVKEIVEVIKEINPKTKIVLGGILPTLMPEFTKKFFGDKIIYFYSSLLPLSTLLDVLFGIRQEHKKFDSFENYPIPDFSFYKSVNYVVLRTSYGCFYNCDYCSCRNINPFYTMKSISKIVQEIGILYQQTQTSNFVFYDDALFDIKTTRIKKIFYELLKLNLPLKIYTPNGINPSFIDLELAKLMYDLNFTDPRLSLETTNDKIHSVIDNKINLKTFEQGLNNLIKSGYKPQNISVYILAGILKENIEDVYNSVNLISQYGLRIRLCEFSPVPKSKMFYEYGFDENIDPLLHNNSIFLYYGNRKKKISWCKYEELQKLKLYVKNLNEKIKEQKIYV